MSTINTRATEIVQRIYALAEQQYRFTNGWTAKREGGRGKWVLRNEQGERIDSHKYRIDLFQRHGLEMIQAHV